MDSIKGSLIWILFVEYDNEIRVRLRSRYIPVVSIGEQFNGGGHANACGASLPNKKQIKELLSVADNNLKEFKKENKELF
jgi:phosphoesterase RecJ-like protein